MKTAAKLLVVLSFLGGAFLASLDATTMHWPAFLPVMLAGAVGVYLVKRAENLEASDETLISSNRKELTESLSNIVRDLTELEGRKDKVPTYEMRFEIDRMFRHNLMRFADARESLKHMYGIQLYADIMSSFAAGERYLNRVSSASTDGYVDEVLTYVEKALVQFKEAETCLKNAEVAHSQTGMEPQEVL